VQAAPPILFRAASFPSRGARGGDWWAEGGEWVVGLAMAARNRPGLLLCQWRRARLLFISRTSPRRARSTSPRTRNRGLPASVRLRSTGGMGTNQPNVHYRTRVEKGETRAVAVVSGQSTAGDRVPVR
jgi:hypothetical protein